MLNMILKLQILQLTAIAYLINATCSKVVYDDFRKKFLEDGLNEIKSECE